MAADASPERFSSRDMNKCREFLRARGFEHGPGTAGWIRWLPGDGGCLVATIEWHKGKWHATASRVPLQHRNTDARS